MGDQVGVNARGHLFEADGGGFGEADGGGNRYSRPIETDGRSGGGVIVAESLFGGVVGEEGGWQKGVGLRRHIVRFCRVRRSDSGHIHALLENCLAVGERLRGTDCGWSGGGGTRGGFCSEQTPRKGGAEGGRGEEFWEGVGDGKGGGGEA